MRFIRVTGEFKRLPSDCKSWHFTGACGNGPVFTSTAATVDSPISSLPVIQFSSPDVEEGKLHLKVFTQSTDCEETANEQRDNNAPLLVATRTVTLLINESSNSTDFTLKTSAGDLLNAASTLY